MILSDLKKFNSSNANNEELSSKLKNQKGILEYSICPIIDLSFDQFKKGNHISLSFERRNNQQHLSPIFIENLLNLTSQEIDQGAFKIRDDQFLEILEASKSKHIEINETFQNKRKKLIVSDSSVKIPIQIKHLESDKVLIKRNAFLNHALYRNKKEAWLIKTLSDSRCLI